jgi:hypothetical protein
VLKKTKFSPSVTSHHPLSTHYYVMVRCNFLHYPKTQTSILMIKMGMRNQIYHKAKIVEDIVIVFKNDTISVFFPKLSSENNIFCVEELMGFSS